MDNSDGSWFWFMCVWFVKGVLLLFMFVMSVLGSVYGGCGGEKVVYIVVLGELIMICICLIVVYC